MEKGETPVDTETYQDPTLTVQPYSFASLFFVFIEFVSREQTVVINFLFSFNSTNQGLKVGKAVLLVDGYNVCGYWPKLKKYFMDGRLFIARQKLIDELRAFSARRGWFFKQFLTIYTQQMKLYIISLQCEMC